MSYLEDSFATWLFQEDVPQPVREHRFHPERKWRFDFAWPLQLVAVEIEGGIYKGGKHRTIDGFLADADKYLEAVRLGWRVLRVPGPWVAEGGRTIWKPEVMSTLRELLA